ncbi:MAG: substrate-binding domain-containing protein [Planctomycetota bacterium]
MSPQQHRPVVRHFLILIAHCSLLLALLAGCDEATDELVLYTSVDEPIARPIVERFTADTGIAVKLVTDTEASKSVGLAERLRAERDRPRADVWWGNEPFYTVGLAEDGLFRPIDIPADIHPSFVGTGNFWVGNGLRARVIGISDQMQIAQKPNFSSLAFAEGVVAARPTAGTTGGHVAFIYATLGQDAGDAYFSALRDNGITLVGGNGPAAQAVADGVATYALTDNDDVAHRTGIAAIIPNDTLYIPTTVALVAGRNDTDAAKLAAYLASAEVEAALANVDFTIASVRDQTTDVRYEDIARILRPAIARATGLLEGRDRSELPPVE